MKVYLSMFESNCYLGENRNKNSFSTNYKHFTLQKVWFLLSFDFSVFFIFYNFMFLVNSYNHFVMVWYFYESNEFYFISDLGSEESVKFLLKLGAPTGVYDSYGCSAVQMMIEKMPTLAYEGLNQFYVEDHAMRRRYYYLDHLDYDVKSRAGCKYARNVLQVHFVGWIKSAINA